MSRIKQIQGHFVEDADESLILDVRPEDIRGSTKLDPHNCAAARSIKRVCRASDAIVMRGTTYVNRGNKKSPHWIRYQTPNSIAREITAFDRGAQFEAGVYNFRPFAPSNRLGAKKTKKHDGKYKRAAPRHITAKIREA